MRTRQRRSWTTPVQALIGLGIGIAIAVVDASPGWDDTGITAFSLIAAAGILAAIDGRRPWLWALLVGAPTPIIEIATGGNTGSILAFLFAAIGAAAGWAMRAASGTSRGDVT